MSDITIITWTSGVGKTTLKKLFSKQYGELYEVFDFDDVWVPEDADTERRLQTTQYRLDKMRDNQKKWIKSVLFGQLVPDEIASYKDDISFILLEASWQELQKRLQERWWEKERIMTYKLWTDHIKNSVMHQKKWNIVSTMNSLQEAINNIFTFVSK